MEKDKVFDIVLEKIRNEEIVTETELNEHMMELKNRGILTKGQIDARYEELSSQLGVDTRYKTGTRSPKVKEYAYSNVSAGFSKTGMLMFLAISVPVMIAMINLLNK